MPFGQSSWRYYESNFEAMLNNWSSEWSFWGCWQYYNVGFFCVIILRLAFGIPIPCYAYHKMLRFLYSLLLKVHGITIRSILRQCLKIEAHSGLSKVYDIIITQASFMWLFRGSLSWFNVTCSVFWNAFYLMLTAILCACNPFLGVHCWLQFLSNTRKLFS